MNPNREEALFALALEKPAERRAAFLDTMCEGDRALRTRLDALLAAHEATGGVLGNEPVREAIAPTVDLPEPGPDETVGMTLGRYKLREKLGEGGCGAVYVAEQTEPVRRRVALKVIKLGMDTREVIARFEAERQALAMMDHPNIAKVLDAGTTDAGRPYFVMELVRGIKITDYCDQANLSTKERLDLFIKVCRAIQHAHQKGIIHRDIKPGNILVTMHDGVPVPKVIDFGIAKATEGRLVDATVYTQLHQFMGTPAYMSPEQAEMSGLDVDTRSDIYSLGVLLYQLLTSKTPFDGKELMSMGVDAMRKTIREKEPMRPSTRLATLQGEELTTTAKRRSADAPKLIHLLKGDLDWIVMKCLEKDRTRRYDTANGLAMDIQRHLAHEPVVARPPSAGYRFQKAFRRNKLVFAATGAVAAALVFGILASVWQAARATRAEREQRSLRATAETARAGEAAQRLAAETARTGETKLRKLAQVQAYAANMKAAQAALQQSSRQYAVNLLDQYWPKPSEPDLRGIEWRYLWQAARGDEIYTWKHPGMVAGARFSPDGRNVATACFDGMLRIWNVASGKLVTQFDRGVSDEAVHLSFCYAPDGSTLASASRGGIVLLDGATLRVKRTLELSAAEAAQLGEVSMVYSPDGQWLAAAFRRSSVRVWNTVNGEAFTLPVRAMLRISFSPDGKSLAVPVPTVGIELWDLATRMKTDGLSEPSASGGNHLTQFSPQGDRLVSAGGSGKVVLWDVPSQKAVWVRQAHRSRIVGLAFSHDGKRFASGGFDQLIHIWDSATQEKVMTLQGHLNEIWSLEFSPDDRYLLTSSKDGTVKLWDAQAKPPSTHWMLDEGEWPIGFTPDGRGLISVSADDSTVRQWQGPEVVKSLPCATRLDRDRVAFSFPSQSLYVLSRAGEVQVQDVNTLKVKRAFKISQPSSWLYHVSPDERWLTGRDATAQGLYVWDTASGEAVAHIEGFDGRSNSRDLARFSPDSRVLALATKNWEVKLWDTAKRQFLRTLPPHPWRIYAISFSHDGRYVAGSSWAGDVRLFEVATGQEAVAPLHGGGSGVHGHSFSPDDATLVSGGDDSMVRFWNVATGREMLTFANAYNQLARLPFLSPTGELMVWRDFAQNLQVRVETIPTLAEIEKANAASNTAR